MYSGVLTYYWLFIPHYNLWQTFEWVMFFFFFEKDIGMPKSGRNFIISGCSMVQSSFMLKQRVCTESPLDQIGNKCLYTRLLVNWFILPVIPSNISTEAPSIIGHSFDRVARATNYCLSPTNDGICVKCPGNYYGLILSGPWLNLANVAFCNWNDTLRNDSFLSPCLHKSWDSITLACVTLII